jgi:hypothetical protein
VAKDKASSPPDVPETPPPDDPEFQVRDSETTGQDTDTAPTADTATTGDTPPPDATASPNAEEQSPEEFRAAQKAEAERQNLTDPNAVPEQRPQASIQPPAPHSDLTQRLIDEGVLNTEPMPAEAFTKAASDAQMETAASESRTPQLHPGLVVRVTEGPHRDRIVAVTRVVSYKDNADLALVTAGGPEARFVEPAEIEGRAIGDDRDGEVLVLVVEDAGLEIIQNFSSLARR